MWHYHKYLRFRCTCIYNSIYTNIYNIQCSYMDGSISCTWILSCMKYWTWKSSRRNESPNWSLRITSATVRPFHVTFNKTWIQWYTTEIKEESNSPANLLRRMSAGKAETQSKGSLVDLLGRFDVEEKSALPPWQRSHSHHRRRYGQISPINLRTTN